MIAAILADIPAAEAIIWEAYKTRKSDWDMGYSDNVGDILTIVAKQDVEAAEKLWKIVEELEWIEPYRVRVATRLLENLGSLGS